MAQFTRSPTANADGMVASPAAVQRALGSLRAIADGSGSIRAVRHPLGFLCLPLERRDDGYGVCVHIWTSQLVQARPTTSEVHAHSWELLSVVILGELRNDLFAIADEHPTHRVFDVHSDGDVDELRATPRLVSRRTTHTERHRPGDTYTVAPGQFHTTIALEAVTVAFGQARPGARDRSLGAIDAGTHRVRRIHCDLAETVGAARSVVLQL